jgi:hypothetical protein
MPIRSSRILRRSWVNQMKIEQMRNISSFIVAIMLGSIACADMPTTAPIDSPAEKEVRQQIIAWDNDMPKMSLAECRKCYYTQTDREAVYTDWQAHENWEANKTEQAVRDKWGPEADAKFAHVAGYSSREDDAVCHIKVDGNRATLTWDLKDMTPEILIKIDGHWLIDQHSEFADWLKTDPTMETDRRSTGKLMRQAREDIAGGKFDDADAFIADFKNKWENPQPEN